MFNKERENVEKWGEVSEVVRLHSASVGKGADGIALGDIQNQMGLSSGEKDGLRWNGVGGA